MDKFWCSHCKTLLTSEDELRIHQSLAMAEAQEMKERGGIFVDVDGDKYWAPSVSELKANGFRVMLRYYRYYKGTHWFSEVRSKGGACHIILLAPDGVWSEGWSRCSRKDVFSKKKGYVLAVNEALSNLPGDLYSFDKDFIEALKTAVSEDG